MPLVRKPAADGPSAAPDSRSVIQALSSPDPDARWLAARAAAALAASAANATAADANAADAAAVDAAVVELARALPAEADPRVREAMLTSLARLGTPVAVEALCTQLRSPAAAERTAVLGALRTLRDLRAVAAQLLRDPDPDVRVLSCELVRPLPAAQSNALLCELLDDEPNVNVCAAAIDVLAEVGGPQSLASLAACAARFPTTQFLVFAVTLVVARINADLAGTRD